MAKCLKQELERLGWDASKKPSCCQMSLLSSLSLATCCIAEAWLETPVCVLLRGHSSLGTGHLGAFPTLDGLAAGHRSASAGAGNGRLPALQKLFAAAPRIRVPKKLPLLCSHRECSAWSLPCSPGTCCPSEAVHHPAAWSQPSLPTPLGMFGRDPEGQVTHRTAAGLQVQHCSVLSGREHGIVPIPRDPPALGDAA